jgi:hypothetical protein
MSGTPMSQDERQDLAALKYKEQQGTITAAEQAELDSLRDTFQCDD